jgi:hypothetical protein
VSDYRKANGAGMTKYEYKIIDTKEVESAGLFKGRKPEDIEAYLNSLGAEG